MPHMTAARPARGDADASAAAEQVRRAEIVQLARLGSALEGWRSSELTHAAQDAYVRGEIDLDDLVAYVQAGPTLGCPPPAA